MPLKIFFTENDLEHCDENIDLLNENDGLDIALYKQLYAWLSKPFLDGIDKADSENNEVTKTLLEEALEQAKIGWKKMAYALANGTVTYLTNNMEIHGIQTTGQIKTSIQGCTQASDAPPIHEHTVTLTGIQNEVVFSQNDDGRGHVR